MSLDTIPLHRGAKLPRSGRDAAMLKADREKDLKDAEQLALLSTAFEQELKSQDSHILAVGTAKKLEEIEKIVRRLRDRMKHY